MSQSNEYFSGMKKPMNSFSSVSANKFSTKNAKISNSLTVDGPVDLNGGLSVRNGMSVDAGTCFINGGLSSTNGTTLSGTTVVNNSLAVNVSNLGFFNGSTVTQRGPIANATDASSAITQLNALLVALRQYNLIHA